MSGFSVKKRPEHGIVSRLFFGVSCALCFSAILTLVFALILLKIPGAEDHIAVLSYALCALCGLACGAVASRILENRTAYALLCGLLCGVLLAALSVIFGAALENGTVFFIKAAVYLAATGIGTILWKLICAQKRKRRKADFASARKKVKKFPK